MTSKTDGRAKFLNQYELLSLLGEGGMGEVWAARDTSAVGVRVVALKTTKQQGAEAARVLFDEARIASQIDHPNVCRVHEFGRVDGTQYLVLDWCDGASLHELLQSVPDQVIAPELAAWLGVQVAAGLHAAHELRDEHGELLHVVHRDVSPQNVLLSRSGAVTVTDFGVAKAAGQAHRATETGEVKGKLSYMAPEQVKSKNVDRRADVFALGCVLYQITLGHRAFAGADALATMYQIVEGTIVPPLTIRPHYPPGLDAIVMRALAKDPDQRFQTARELGKALENWLFDQGARVDQRQLSQFLLQHLGAKIDARNRAVVERSQGLPPTPVVQTETIVEPSSATRVEGTSSVKTARKGSLGIALGAASLVIAAAGALWLGRGVPATGPETTTEQPAPSPKSDTTEPKPLTEAPAAAVVVEVTVKPNDSKIYVDGALNGVGRANLTRPAGSAAALLSVEREGYRTERRSFDFTKSQTVEIELIPDKVRASSKPGAKPTSTSAPDSGGTTTSSGTGTMGKKPPRPLDVDNPFNRPGSP